MARRKEVTMAYMCVLAPSHECDGCQECEQGYDEKYDDYDELAEEIAREDRILGKYYGEAMI
jgi:hypothetical protein